MYKANFTSWEQILLISLWILVIPGEASFPKRKVCIIGTGPSGLIATKYVVEHPDEFEVVTFEKQADVGGMWLYTDSTTVDKHGLPVHSSLYKTLRINGPKEFLTYPDFIKFTAGNGSFVSHTYVLEYLKNYTEHFNLRKYIQLWDYKPTNKNRACAIGAGAAGLISARQLSAYPEEFEPMVFEKQSDVGGLWIYTDSTTVDEHGLPVHSSLYKYLRVNFPKEFATFPDYPEFKGDESKGSFVEHTQILQYLRNYTEFYNLRRFILFNTNVEKVSPLSGKRWLVTIQDLNNKKRHEIRCDAVFVFNGLTSELPTNIEQVPGVVASEGGELILSDDSRIKVDALILCTGYFYDFPFLDASSGIVVEGCKYVRSVYKHLINIERPTMAIMNLPKPGLPLVVPHLQVAYFIEVLRGKLKLPSREDMLSDAALPPGMPKKNAHHMVEEIIFYYNDLAQVLGYDPLPDWLVAAGLAILPQILGDPLHFRDKKIHFNADGSVEFN